MSYQTGVMLDDWQKAWRTWAGTRKRGKMAQFIVRKLEEQKQAMWLDISKGKFQLTEWHAIADEWFRQKPRSSDQVDAPCMLRKGLPRAFPGLEEVKSESIKEGTQYRSRVFVATPQLMQEVSLYINKPMYPGQFGTNGTPANVFASGGFQTQLTDPSAPVSMNGYLPSPPVKLEETIDVINSPGSSDAHSPAYVNGHYPQTNSAFLGGGGSEVMPDGSSTSPYGGSPYNDSPLNGLSYSTPNPMLNVPASEGDNWSSAASYSPAHSEQASYYTQSPESYQQPLSPGTFAVNITSPNLLQVQPFPNQSPLEGGGQLALLFSGELPAGSKWLSFNSHSRPEYMVQVEAVQGHDSMALTAIIPKHEFPETVLLTVMAQGQLIAQTEFTYYGSAQYNSDMLFHYLTQSLPQYFTDVSMGGHMDLGGNSVGGASGYSNYGYGPNVPSTSYSLLLGSCRLGIEQLVYGTLQLKSMASINTVQLMKAHDLAQEHSHTNIAKTLKLLAELQDIVGKGEDAEKIPAVQTESGRKAMAQLVRSGNPLATIECAEGILSRLKSIAVMEEKTQSEGSEAGTPTAELTDKRPDFRRSSSNKLTRQQKKEDEDLLELPSTDKHSRGSIAELKDTVPPLPTAPRGAVSVRGSGRKMLIATHSDAADSAVSMSFDGDSNEYSAEVVRRNSARDASLGLFQFNRESAECISVKINAESAYTLANSLQYECSYQVTDDYPPNSNPSNVLFKAGDKIVMIGDTAVKDKGPDDFAVLLQQESVTGDGVSIRIIPRLSPPPPAASLSLGYGSLDLAEKAVLSRRQSEQQLVSSITMKVSNLLSMKGPGPKRTVTIPRSAGGQGFKLVGGSAVGLFISEVAPGRDEIKVGDQVLEVGGQSTLGMTHFEATEKLAEHKDKVQLKIMENTAKYNALYLQFEHDSFYIRTLVDHTPTESKDMTLKHGGLARVVNCSLDPNHWFAWAVDESTGADTILRRIPNPSKAYGQFNKHVYEKLPSSNIQELISS